MYGKSLSTIFISHVLILRSGSYVNAMFTRKFICLAVSSSKTLIPYPFEVYFFVDETRCLCICWCRLLITVSNSLDPQGGHRLEKYLNLEGFLEKTLKIKSALKSTGNSLKSLEQSLNSTIFCRT